MGPPLSTNEQLWNDLQKIWKEVNAGPDKTVQDCQRDAGKFFRENKKNPEVVKRKINELRWKTKSKQQSQSSQLFKAFSKSVKYSKNNQSTSSSESLPSSSRSERRPSCGQDESPPLSDGIEIIPLPPSPPPTSTHKRSAPTQEKFQQQLDDVNSQIASYSEENGLIEEIYADHVKELQVKKNKIEKEIKKLKGRAAASSKNREKNNKIMTAIRNNPDLYEQLSVKPRLKKSVGRPAIEEDQPILIKTILDIAINNSKTHERRRDESMTYCRTLDQLHAAVEARGFKLSKTSLYYRLLPKNSTTIEGRRHHHTVPVKLRKAQNNARKGHDDSHFAASSIRHIKDLAELLGPEVVTVISQDDKARVPLGLAAAQYQSPILMHLEYSIKLPDHDWVVATKHKLIPSVYAALTFKETGALGYSGPTYIAIRSGKHDKSTAQSHSIDLHRLLDLESFKAISKTEEGGYKPVMIILVDGGPDENPRFPKTLQYAASNFLEFNLDCLIVATHAPHQSAYNPVERRMAPLSKELAGVILDHEACGAHLDQTGKTINAELEVQNFQHAGNALASIWSNTVIDSYSVTAEYIVPPEDGQLEEQTGAEMLNMNLTKKETKLMEEQWKTNHVRQSKYLLQIMKCHDVTCCPPRRSNVREIINGFLPPPIMYNKTSRGIEVVKVGEKVDKAFFGGLSQRNMLKNIDPVSEKFQVLPYDYYCPSAQGSLEKQYCQTCFISFPSQLALQNHKRTHGNPGKVVIEVSMSQRINNNQNDNDSMQVIENMEEFHAPVFVALSAEELAVADIIFI